MKFFSFLAIFLLAQIGFTQTTPEGWARTDSKYISIAHPSDYKVTNIGEMNIVMSGIEPLEGDGDKFKENFGIIINDLSAKQMTLDEFANSSKDQIMQSNTSPKMEKFERIETSQGPAYDVEYRMEIGDFPFYYYLRLYVKNNKGYSVLYTTASTRRTYHEPIVKGMFDSVILK